MKQVSERFDNRPKVRGNALPDNPDPKARGRFPSWLHRKLPKGGNLWRTGQIVGDRGLPTVCEEARCPNLFECWSKKTATFLAMGSECTRACGFCDIDTTQHPPPLEADEPDRIAASVEELGLRHAVITMVARDDQPDGGAAHLAQIVRAVRAKNPGVTVELLTTDFGGDRNALDRLLQEPIEVFNHNLETVERLTPRVRHRATYRRSLQVLEWAEAPHRKSGLMLGLGETQAEVHQALRDLRDAGCTIVTMGQYLQPNRRKLLVKRFVTPEEFDAFAAYGKEIGIPHMYCGPFVRSSYNADLFV